MLFNIDDMPKIDNNDKIVLAGKLKNPAKFIPGFPKYSTDFWVMRQQRNLPVLNQELLNYFWRMIKASLKFNGMGLAANQIGIDKRIFVIQESDKIFKGYIHPAYKVDSESVLDSEAEGCLSVPKYTFTVPRNSKIIASWFEFDENQTLIFKEEVLESMHARVFQHELDHLEGITIIDKAIDINRDQKRTLLKSLK